MAGFFCSAVAEERQCAVCPKPIIHLNKKTRTCGPVCGKVLSDQTRSDNARLRNLRVCQNAECGRDFQKQRNAPGKFCSLKCTAAVMRKYADKTEAKRAEHARSRLRRGIPEPQIVQCRCGETFQQRNHRHVLHSDVCRAESAREYARQRYVASDERDRSPRACGNAACGKTFSPAYGEKNSVFCSTACLKDKLGRIKHAARRAKEAGVEIEVGLDPFEIFERDGWRCYICGDPTPKDLRGTRHPKAPELDHVKPIVAGGSHTSENTACACKACNFKKGSDEAEQPGYLRPDWRLLKAA